MTTVDVAGGCADGEAFLLEMRAFADQFDCAVASVVVEQGVLDILQEEKYQRARLLDQQDEAFYLVQQTSWACLMAFWKDSAKDHEKMAFTEKLMTQYYDRVVTGEKWWSDLMTRRESISQEKRHSSLL